MAISRTQSSAPVSQTQVPSQPLKLPRAWEKGPARKPDGAMWDKLREDLFQKSGRFEPKHKATMADVDRVIARAEKNDLSPKELYALMSIKSTQHLYFEGGADSAAWKKLNNYVTDAYYAPGKRVLGELERRTKGGTIDAAGAKKLMEWVRDENTTQGAAAMKRAVVGNQARLTPDAKALLDAFFAKVELPQAWSPAR